MRAWAQRCSHDVGSGLLFPIRSPYLQEGRQRLIVGSEREDHRWHAWRRTGAWQPHMLGLPIRWLQWWGRRKSEQIARSYASPDKDIEPAVAWKLPAPPEDGRQEGRLKWQKLRGVFPSYLVALCRREVSKRRSKAGAWDSGFDRSQFFGQPKVKTRARYAIEVVRRLPTDQSIRKCEFACLSLRVPNMVLRMALAKGMPLVEIATTRAPTSPPPTQPPSCCKTDCRQRSGIAFTLRATCACFAPHPITH